jgi:hypothetical protein
VPAHHDNNTAHGIHLRTRVTRVLREPNEEGQLNIYIRCLSTRIKTVVPNARSMSSVLHFVTGKASSQTWEGEPISMESGRGLAGIPISEIEVKVRRNDEECDSRFAALLTGCGIVLTTEQPGGVGPQTTVRTVVA